MKCKCVTTNGTKCQREGSKVPGKDGDFCWQHQKCARPYVGDLPMNVINKIAKKRQLETIQHGVLTVSAYANFYPVCYIDDDGKLAGVDVDIMHEFAKFTGLKLNFIIKDQFNGIWFDPINGVSDIAIGGIGITAERTTPETLWTIPYFYVNRTVIYNLANPINDFPFDVTGIIRGTKGSTGFLDGYLKLKKVGKADLLVESNNDKADVQQLLKGNIQGLLRGSFVGKSIVSQYPSQLGMSNPFEMDSSLVSSDGEVFAYPTNENSGVGILLTMFLTKEMINYHLPQLIFKYDLD